METRRSNTWIWVALGVCAGLVVCCGLALVVTVGVPAAVRLVRDGDWDRVQTTRLGGERTERVEETIDVGTAPELVVDSFAGRVTIRAGGDGSVRIVATKHVPAGVSPEEIVLTMRTEGSRVRVTARPTQTNVTKRWVEFDITVPAQTALDVRTGAGAVEVRGVQGDLEVDAGAGGIEIEGAAGSARLTAGAGGIDYAGRPSGSCTFRVGAGGITLRFPADTDVEVDLAAGVGGVSSQLPVYGRVARHSIHGRLGTGEKGRVSATAGVGGVNLLRW
ncbi:MAG TPA: hypothetical protein PKO09_05820 [Anaerolineae bacterium]|nr:hypothetical protein [Anaerolineae bacterium]